MKTPSPHKQTVFVGYCVLKFYYTSFPVLLPACCSKDALVCHCSSFGSPPVSSKIWTALPSLSSIAYLNSRTPQRSCRAAHGAKHLPFCAAAIRRRRFVYLSGGLKPATETSRILTYPPLTEAGVFPTEINVGALQRCITEYGNHAFY